MVTADRGKMKSSLMCVNDVANRLRDSRASRRRACACDECAYKRVPMGGGSLCAKELNPMKPYGVREMISPSPEPIIRVGRLTASPTLALRGRKT